LQLAFCYYYRNRPSNDILRMLSIRLRFLITLSSRHTSSFTSKRIDTVPSFIHSYLFGTPTPSTAVENDEVAKLKLPKLHGGNLESHFRSIANQQVAPYRTLLESVEAWGDLPNRPETWIRRKGWTRYGRDGKETEQVPYPLEDVFLYDVETCVIEGQLPTLAIALSENSWYSWCSPRLSDPDTVAVPKFPNQSYLIPLGGESKPRIAIGHNVGYDRVRAREPYDRKHSHIRFWDTMSMSIPLIGMADHQVKLYGSDDIGVGEGEGWRDEWKGNVSKNGLAHVHKFFYGGDGADKAMQKFFVKEPMSRVIDEFQNLTTYCADDVLLTLQIYQKLAPLFREHFPHPATMAGMITMSEAYLPINLFWRMFYEKSEAGVAEQTKSAVSAVLEAARDRLQNHDPSTPDTFMWADKWALKSIKTKIPNWVVDLFSDASTAMSVHEDSYDVEKVVDGIKMKSNIIPRLFGLCYGPYPLHFRREHGWGFLVPNKVAAKGEIKVHLQNDETVVFPSTQIRSFVLSQSLEHGNPVLLEEHVKRKKGEIGDCTFYQLPHPNGKGNVGSPIGKDFMGDIEQKVIRATRHPELFDAYVQSIKNTTFWKSFRERYGSELPIWPEEVEGDSDTDPSPADGKSTVASMEGIIAPAICPAGTISRRSVHKLWVTATNASEGTRIGVGLKSMVQAHRGTLFVGADVDSQEQWIAGLYGDASASERLAPSDRAPGCTPFSNMMLAGSKSDNSDLHSVIARDMGISRHAAKVLNYARLYGSGERHSVEELEKSGVKREEAERKARQLFTLTKGDRRQYRQLKRSMNAFFDAFLEEAKEKSRVDEEAHLFISGSYFLPEYGETGCKLTLAFEDWIVKEYVKRTREEGSAPSSSDLLRVIPSLYEDESMGGILRLYSGGYESDTFNFLELASTRSEIRTPVLGARLGSSLSPLEEDIPDRERFAAKYKRSVINWMVQSSAVDFLHLLLVCLEHLAKEYDIDARFSISIHDEVRYVVAERDADRFALALMLANMYVRAFISQRVGIHQLPMSCAFFSQVDVDSVLRKEVDSRCVNPDGSVVESGRALTISDVIKATGGSLEKK
ncbi:polg-1, partial [Pristionchus pacificus]